MPHTPRGRPQVRAMSRYERYTTYAVTKSAPSNRDTIRRVMKTGMQRSVAPSITGRSTNASSGGTGMSPIGTTLVTPRMRRMIPAIAAMISIWGLLFDPQQITQQIRSVTGALPEGAAGIINDQVEAVAAGAGAGVSIAAIIGILLALYSASKGMKAMIEGLNMIYDEEEKRGFIKLTLVTLVLTLGRLRAKQVRAFFRASAGAEASFLEASGVIWATALARPPFVSTCSLWESTKALSTYAYGKADHGHPDAIHADTSAGGFHHQSAFIRFRPFAFRGHLDGRNPLADVTHTGG